MKALIYIAAFMCLLSVMMLFSSCQQHTDQAQNTDSKDAAQEMNKPASDATKEMDERFLVRAAEINHHEIRLGQLAQEKGNTACVKEFGKMMESAHTKAQQDLHALSSAKGIAVPLVATHSTESMYQNLSEKSISEFDLVYCAQMESGHQDAINLYEGATRGNHDPEIKNWAYAMLGELRQHLTQIEACKASLPNQ